MTSLRYEGYGLGCRVVFSRVVCHHFGMLDMDWDVGWHCVGWYDITQI